MKQHKTNLCIGGPLDGKRYDAGDRPSFRAPTLPKLSVTAPLEMDAMVTVIEVIYQRMHWRCGPDDVVTIWVPSDKSPLDAMMRLIEVYEVGASFWGKERT